MYKIKAVLQSPLMIGGKTLNSNYRESRDYIPGSVLRAAYAKALIQRCACEQKNYWLDYKGQDVCKECSFKFVCENFAHIKFPALYPLGSSPYPVTARKKKYENEGEHSILDILKSRLVTQEKADGESEWIRLEGFHCNGVPVRLLHSAITRTAIDYQRNASKEGSLYTQNVIAEKYLDENRELADVIFSGDICLTQDMEKELVKIKVLHIGADLTRGFGICHMSLEESEEDDTPEKIAERIQEFHYGISTEEQFVILDLMTDAYLGLEKIGEDNLSQTNFSDEQMSAFLEEMIGLPKNRYKLWKAYKFQEVFRGFDTSKATEKEMRRQGQLVVKAGAVFVYRSLVNEIDTEELLKLEQHGIGRHVEHGFGKIRICDSFHIEYDIIRRITGMDNDIQLAAERVLKRETKQFLEEIKHLMETDGVERSLKSKTRNNKIPGRTQFKSLMDAVSEASCIEELVLFLSYQEAKNGGWENKCVNGYSIAKNVVNSLMKILDAIYPIIKKEYGNHDINDEEERKLQLKIAEKYMGYLYWTAYVVSGEGER